MAALASLLVLLLLALLVLLFYLLYKHTDAKRILYALAGWQLQDEEQAILSDHDQMKRDSEPFTKVYEGETTVISTSNGGFYKDVRTEAVSSAPIPSLPPPPAPERPVQQEQDTPSRQLPSVEKLDVTSPMHKCPSLSSEDSFLEQLDERATSKLQRAYSSESIDSTCSALELTTSDQDLGQLEIRIFYDSASQLFHIWVLQAYDLKYPPGTSNELEFWVVIFLLPHPKPLWRTQLQSGSSNPLAFHQEFEQCVRPGDLSKIALLCQMYCRDSKGNRTQDVKLVGQCRVRIKDVSLDEPNTMWLALLPATYENEGHGIGEMLFSVNYLPVGERLTVVVSKIRQLKLEQSQDRLNPKIQARVYLVQGSKVSKKKTSAKELQDGSVTFNESMIFNLPQSRFNKVYLRLSVSDQPEMGDGRTLGHVTIGSRRSGKELGHWQKMCAQPRKPVAMWHSIVPKRT